MATAVSATIATTGTGYIDGILTTSSWNGGGATSLTYAFYDGDSGSWTAAQKANVAAGLQTISNVANITFTEVSADATALTSSADMTFNFFTDVPNSYGMANFPDPQYEVIAQAEEGYTSTTYPNPEGDVYLNSNSPAVMNNLAAGGLGFTTVIHEVGHAIGLKHPHDGGPNEAFPSRAQVGTYEEYGIGSQDTQAYTYMSYDRVFEESFAIGQVATPMINDIEALQHIYGANTTYNSGNTTYALSDDNSLKAVWDAGGTDTFDASAMASAVTINLTPGTFTQTGEFSFQAIGRNVSIENAIGSSGGDAIVGNTSANALIGGSGSDTISGGSGGDIIYGNTSDDAIYGDGGNDTVYGGQNDDTISGGEGDDVIYGNLAIDNISGGNGVDTIYGGQGNDYIEGEGSADQIAGNLGDDTIIGGDGNDVLIGGGGNDAFVYYEGDGSDHIYDFASGDVLAIAIDAVGALGNRSESMFYTNATESDGNTIFNMSDGSTLTLFGITKSSLSTSDFYFI